MQSDDDEQLLASLFGAGGSPGGGAFASDDMFLGATQGVSDVASEVVAVSAPATVKHLKLKEDIAQALVQQCETRGFSEFITIKFPTKLLKLKQDLQLDFVETGVVDSCGQFADLDELEAHINSLPHKPRVNKLHQGINQRVFRDPVYVYLRSRFQAIHESELDDYDFHESEIVFDVHKNITTLCSADLLGHNNFELQLLIELKKCIQEAALAFNEINKVKAQAFADQQTRALAEQGLQKARDEIAKLKADKEKGKSENKALRKQRKRLNEKIKKFEERQDELQALVTALKEQLKKGQQQTPSATGGSNASVTNQLGAATAMAPPKEVPQPERQVTSSENKKRKRSGRTVTERTDLMVFILKFSNVPIPERSECELQVNTAANKHEIDAVKQQTGNTPLHYAVLMAAVDVVDLLLNAGADNQVLNNSGHTAYQILMKFKETEPEKYNKFPDELRERLNPQRAAAVARP